MNKIKRLNNFRMQQYSVQSDLFTYLPGHYVGKDVNTLNGSFPGYLRIKNLNDDKSSMIDEENNNGFRIDSKSWNTKIKNILINEFYLCECFASSILDSNELDNGVIEYNVKFEAHNEYFEYIGIFKFHDENLIEYELTYHDLIKQCVFNHGFTDLVKINFNDPISSTLLKINEMSKQQLASVC